MRTYLLFLSLILTSGSLWSQETPELSVRNSTNTPGLAQEFNWQDKWGSIHMNTSADGMEDPGSAGSSDNIPCMLGNICSVFPDMMKPVTNIDNGIKFDIKNSVLNCMAKPHPNYPIKNGGWNSSYSKPRCGSIDRVPGYAGSRPYMVYSPIWDPRGNDESQYPSIPGCLQQISNHCVQDIHDCQKVSKIDDEGFNYPVTHIFTPQEVTDLGGKGPMPLEYYAYKKATEFGADLKDQLDPPEDQDYIYVDKGEFKNGVQTHNYRIVTKYRDALSLTESPSDRVMNHPIKKIENKTDSNLARIKSYEVDLGIDTDVSGMIVIDPSDFFDLNLYVKGGKYDTGYTNIKNGLPQTYDTCPILGLNTGYSGICDPTGKAGCNLPIYGVGQKTTFTEQTGKSFSYSNYTVKWSGYVKSWEFISVEQYKKNTENRRGMNGGRLYADGVDINESPILMVSRSNEYCDMRERYSGKIDTSKSPDLNCIQYKQYQNIAAPGETPEFMFVDLFMPIEDFGEPTHYALSKLITYDKVNGKPMGSMTVKGEGSNYFVGGDGSKKGYASFLDMTAPTYQSITQGIEGGIVKKETLPALKRYDYMANPVLNANKEKVVGEYIDKANPGEGTRIRLAPGETYAVRIPEKADSQGGEISTRCAIFSSTSDLPKDLFIPTGSQEEIKSFLNVMKTRKDTGFKLNIKNCSAQFFEYKRIKDSTKPAANPNGTQTWIGTLSCDQLIQKPSCNQTKIITAERYCLLEDGLLGTCDECAAAADPDKLIDFTLAAVAPDGNGEILSNPKASGNKCFFSAACFNNNSDGCPAADTNGGHVFCFAPETLITMADGSKKKIIDVRPGEKVKAFKGENSKRKNLDIATVKATAVTENQAVIEIHTSFKDKNGKVQRGSVKITPNHKVILSTGRAIMAQDLRPGLRIINNEGIKIEVDKINTDLEKIKVYNLVLEDEYEGYIANDLRVLSYPYMHGMRKLK